MNLDSHKRTLAIMHLVIGILRILFILGVAMFFSVLFPFIESEIISEEGPDAVWILDIISSAFTGIVIFAVAIAGLPSIIGGIATLQKKEYGMVLMLISGCLSLLSFPIGTALGVYTIWVFVENNKAKNEQTSG